MRVHVRQRSPGCRQCPIGRVRAAEVGLLEEQRLDAALLRPKPMSSLVWRRSADVESPRAVMPPALDCRPRANHAEDGKPTQDVSRTLSIPSRQSAALHASRVRDRALCRASGFSHVCYLFATCDTNPPHRTEQLEIHRTLRWFGTTA